MKKYLYYCDGCSRMKESEIESDDFQCFCGQKFIPLKITRSEWNNYTEMKRKNAINKAKYEYSQKDIFDTQENIEPNVTNNIIELECPSCGGILTSYPSIRKAYCKYCGNNFVLNTNYFPISETPKSTKCSKSEWILERDDTIETLTYAHIKVEEGANPLTDVFLQEGTGIIKSFIIKNLFLFLSYLSEKFHTEYILKFKIGPYYLLNDIKKEHIKEALPEYYTGEDNILPLLKKYDFKLLDVHELPQNCYFFHEPEYQRRAYRTKLLINVEKRITRYDYRNHFAEFNDVFSRLNTYPIIVAIGNDIISRLHSAEKAIFIVYKNRITRKSTTTKDMKNYFFKDFNMQDLPNDQMEKIFMALLFSYIMEQTKESGMLEWDLSSIIGTFREKYGSNEGSYYELKKLTVLKKITIENIPVYQSW